MKAEPGKRSGVHSGGLKSIRIERGISASELAKQAGVARQTIYAIEDGSFVPNTLVALRLARSLNVSVEELFWLSEDEPSSQVVRASLLLADPGSAAIGQLVRVYHLRDKPWAAPVQPISTFMPSANGVIQSRSGHTVSVHLDCAEAKRRKTLQQVVMAGCDPALSVLADLALPLGIEIIPVPAASRQALTWLKQGRVHIAGSHLLHQPTGEYNLPIIRRSFPKGGVRVFAFARWEEGLVTKPGNPKGIRSLDDLATGRISIVNREKGSGCRTQLDDALAASAVAGPTIPGYERVAYGHLPAAFGVANGAADCCLATRSAARCFGLGFLPVRQERFDLIMKDDFLASKAGQELASLLNRARLRHRLRMFAGYETAETGKQLL